MTPQFWLRFIGTLVVESALLILLATIASRWLRPARQRRCCLQAAWVALTLLTFGETSGLHFPSLFPRNSAPPQQLTSTLPPSPIAQTATTKFSLTETVLAPVHRIIWPGWFWLSGTALLGLIGGAARIWLWLQGRRMNAVDEETATTTKALCLTLEIALPTLRSWRRTRGPVAFGIFHPMLALPPDFSVRFSREQREVMLAHELAHLAAHDPFWFAAADAITALLWWHPFVWWLRRQFRAACELAADESSALVPAGPAILAETLVAFGAELSASAPAAGLGVAGNGLRSDLARRVNTLLKTSVDWKKLSLAWRVGPALFAILCVLLSLQLPIHAAPFSLIAALDPGPSATSPLRATNSSARVTLITEFVEVPDHNSAARKALEKIFAGHTDDPETEGGPAPDLFADQKLTGLRHLWADHSVTRNEVVVLDQEQFQSVKQLIIQRESHWFHLPKTTIFSGRQAHVASEDVSSIVFDVQLTNGTAQHPAASINYVVNPVQFGSSTDIEVASANGSWTLNTLARCVEFLGYDDYGNTNASVVSWVPPGSPTPGPVGATIPLPHFRVRQTQASAVVKPGQTLMLRGPLGASALGTGEPLFLRLDYPIKSDARLYVFVTVEAVNQ